MRRPYGHTSYTAMQIGASSSCFYPDDTLNSLIRVGELGFKTTEVFLNTPSETSQDFIYRLNEVKSRYALNIVSIHPYMSFAEGYCLFSTYKQRYHDYIEHYKTFFNLCEKVGAKYFVLHGAQEKPDYPTDIYCERFAGLVNTAKDFGVTVAQENVVHYHSQSPDFLLSMRQQLGDDFNMVLDIKQARRAGFKPEEFLSKLADCIVHIHVSDVNDDFDCVPPGEGRFDFEGFFKAVAATGYDGAFIIELYRKSFTHDRQILCAGEFLKKILQKI